MLGQTLGHYRIIAKIGAGGMGEVYRAHDEQLDRDVALKILPVGTLTDEAARKQFRKEALALAKLNHPNIETVHEFGNQGGTDFLVMELITGSSLRDKLKAGPLPKDEVVRLGLQFAEGLSAAHEQGVIHRDLKPGNLMVTRDGRLKILDFGLAKLLQSTDVDATQSISEVTGSVSGTIPYMAPEQLRGEPVDARSDVYAAGATLYEAATGQRPFPQSHGPTLMGAILHETPAPARSINPHVTPALEQILHKSLDKEPARRYQSARELHVALEGVGTAREPVAAERRWTPTVAIVAGAVVAVLLVALSFTLDVGGLRSGVLRHGAPSVARTVSSSMISPRQSIAVLGIKNISGRPDENWLSTAYASALTTELAAGEQLRTIPDENISQMKVGLQLPDTDSYGRETLQKIHRTLDADYVIVGTFIPVGKGQIRLDLRLQDAARGETLASVSEKSSQDDIDGLAKRAGEELRARLGVRAVSESESVEIRAALPSNNEAARLYSEGIEKLQTFDNLKARDFLQKAVEVDPNFALAHSALARAWKSLGYDTKATDEAAKAFTLSANLGRQDHLLVEGQYREMSNDWEKAAEIYDSLSRFFPDNLEYGLLLARAQAHAGKGDDSTATLESLRKLPPPAGEDARIDLDKADTYRSLGNAQQAQLVASRAEQKTRRDGAKLLLARALYLEAWAFENIGDAKKATQACDESQSIYQAAADRNGVASTLEVKGNVLADQGDLAGATSSYKDEIAITRETGNKKAQASALNNLALVLDQQGDLGGAKGMYEQAASAFRQIGDTNNMARALLNIGEVLQEQGDLAGAQMTFEEAMRSSNEVSDKDGVASELTALAAMLDAKGDFTAARTKVEQAISIDRENGRKTPSSDKMLTLGDILRHQGELTAAAKSYTDALEFSRQTGDKSSMASALFGLGELAMSGADFDDAMKDYAQALEMRETLGEKMNVEMAQVAMAELSIEEGHPDQAIASLREIRDATRTENELDNKVETTCLLSRALLAQGKSAEALRELDGIAAVARKTQSLNSRLAFAIANALAAAASGKTSSAVSILNAALRSATKAGFVEFEFGARLALDEVGWKASHSAASRAQLKKLEAEAMDKGFRLIALKAAAAGD